MITTEGETLSSIYNRLFTYRERANRQPLEDYLSEALCDLLNRMPREENVSFVEDLLLPKSDAARGAWRRRMDVLQPASKLVWWTQQRTSSEKRTDLLLKGDGRPLLVVESKIFSSLRQHGDAHPVDVDDNGAPVHISDGATDQLSTYGKWLSTVVGNGDWEGAVTLLTHACPPPADFGSGDKQKYGVPWQRTCRWHDVWKWLRARAAPSGPADCPAWQVLAGELAEYLKEQGMSSENMTPHDLAAAEVYASSADRISNTLQRVQERVMAVLGDTTTKRISGPTFNSTDHAISTSAYLNKNHAEVVTNNYFISWGFQFPSETNIWTEFEPPLPSTVHVFFSLTSHAMVPLAIGEIGAEALPNHWRRMFDDKEIVAVLPVHKFGSPQRDVTDDFAEWAAARATELKPFIKSLTKVTG